MGGMEWYKALIVRLQKHKIFESYENFKKYQLRTIVIHMYMWTIEYIRMPIKKKKMTKKKKQ